MKLYTAINNMITDLATKNLNDREISFLLNYAYNLTKLEHGKEFADYLWKDEKLERMDN